MALHLDSNCSYSQHQSFYVWTIVCRKAQSYPLQSAWIRMPIIRASGTLSVLALFDLIFSNLDNQNITLLICQSKHHLVNMPVERHFVRSNEKQPYLRCPSKLPCWKCPSKGPIPIEKPFADANRRTICRCQSKDLLQMPIKGPFVDANRRAFYK